MGDDLGEPNKPAACLRMQDLGANYIVHHVGYDERRDADVQAALGGRMPNPLDELKEVAITIPVQVVDGLNMEQALRMPLHGAPLVVLGAPPSSTPTRSRPRAMIR